jgi:hypothetical protein
MEPRSFIFITNVSEDPVTSIVRVDYGVNGFCGNIASHL